MPYSSSEPPHKLGCSLQSDTCGSTTTPTGFTIVVLLSYSQLFKFSLLRLKRDLRSFFSFFLFLNAMFLLECSSLFKKRNNQEVVQEETVEERTALSAFISPLQQPGCTSPGHSRTQKHAEGPDRYKTDSLQVGSENCIQTVCQSTLISSC